MNSLIKKNIVTTHVGSLPFRNINEAMEFTFKFDLPVLFSLPLLDSNEFMGRDIIHQLQIGGVNEDQTLFLFPDFKDAIGPYIPPYFDEFMQQMRISQRKKFKYQIIGPFSFYSMLKDTSFESHEIYEFLLGLYRDLIQYLARDSECFFVLDEPFLNKANKAQIVQLNDFMDKLRVLSKQDIGLHICSKIGKEQLNSLNSNFIQLDYSLYTPEDIIKMKAINFIGISLDGANSQELYGAILPQIGQSCLISPSCGLAFKKTQEIDSILKGLSELRRFILAPKSACP